MAQFQISIYKSLHGAKASAILFCLAETAKANGINTYDYFNLLLTEISEYQNDTNLDFLDKLLPWSPSVQKKGPSNFKKS